MSLIARIIASLPLRYSVRELMTASVKLPSLLTLSTTSMPLHDKRYSHLLKSGAMCTSPVPSSVVT